MWGHKPLDEVTWSGSSLAVLAPERGLLTSVVPVQLFKGKKPISNTAYYKYKEEENVDVLQSLETEATELSKEPKKNHHFLSSTNLLNDVV